MTVAASAGRALPRLPRRARVTVLTVHIVTSVGWMWLIGALVALEVIGLLTDDPAHRAGISAAMAMIALWVLVPVVSVSVISGLVLALSTPWGLIQHWWVIAKCAIAGALTVIGLLLLLPRLPQIIVEDFEPVRQPTLVIRPVALMLLLVATGLSVVKPWGRTPHGRRVQRAGRERRRAGTQPTASR